MDESTAEALFDEWQAIRPPVPEGYDPDDDEAPVAPAFDQDHADRLMSRARHLKRELAAFEGVAHRRQEEARLWLEDMTSGITREISRLEASNEAFWRREIRSHPKAKKTLQLPNGEIKLYGGGGKIMVQDEHVFVAWAEANGRKDLLIYKPSVAKAKLSDETEAQRHPGPQVNDPDNDGELVQTFKLMVQVRVDAPEEPGGAKWDWVSVPGVVFAKPVQDRFKMNLTVEEES